MRGASAAREKDPYFNYVTMLLHGDGTNGAQNNTFVDGSTNNFTLTRNGNVTQGSFSPYGSNWSNYFKGGGDYLSNAGTGTTYDLTGDFCVEGFFNFSSLTDVGVWGIQPASGQAGLRLTTESNLTVVLISGQATAHSIFTSSVAPIVGQWNHIAVTRSGSALTLWLNGVSVGTGTSSSWTGSNLPIRLGGNLNYGNGVPYYMNGYISNFRVVKGSAIYTTAFTPPTASLTAITNTQLLTCQSNRFIDNSSNAFALTVTGAPSVQRFNPFGTSTAYSPTSVIGGSALFDGSGDYLTATLTGQTFGTGNFTAEGWFYQTESGAYSTFMAQRTTNNSGTGWIVGFDSGGGVYAYSNGFLIGPTGNAIKNQWNHIAFVRSSGTMTLYLNGVSLGTSATPKTFSDTFAGVGGDGTDAYVLIGYASNVRYVVGTAVYTANFTPPTAPVTAISGTSLLTNFTNGAIFDNAMMNDLETAGNAQISTSVKKYGTGSLAFDGTGDYLYRPSSDLFAFNTGDFTVEFWMYANSTANEKTLMGTASGYRTGGWQIGFNFANAQTNCLQMLIESNPQVIASSEPLSTATWYYIAITRSGTNLRLFVNGTQQGATKTSSSNISDSANNALAIGRTIEGLAGRDYNGYIDDLRITKGYARYTANIAAPTVAFSDTGPY